MGEPFPGLFVFPLLSHLFCSHVCEEISHYVKAAREDPLLPLSIRHDGNVGDLQDCGFSPLLDALHSAIKPLISRRIPQLGEVRVSHAFRTRNFVGRDEVFRIHRDRYELTLNICIHATSDLEGSTVSFFSDPTTEGEVPSEPAAYRLKHQIGWAALHTAQQWHCTDRIIKGERDSLIVWF